MLAQQGYMACIVSRASQEAAGGHLGLIHFILSWVKPLLSLWASRICTTILLVQISKASYRGLGTMCASNPIDSQAKSYPPAFPPMCLELVLLQSTLWSICQIMHHHNAPSANAGPLYSMANLLKYFFASWAICLFIGKHTCRDDLCLLYPWRSCIHKDLMDQGINIIKNKDINYLHSDQWTKIHKMGFFHYHI